MARPLIRMEKMPYLEVPPPLYSQFLNRGASEGLLKKHFRLKLEFFQKLETGAVQMFIILNTEGIHMTSCELPGVAPDFCSKLCVGAPFLYCIMTQPCKMCRFGKHPLQLAYISIRGLLGRLTPLVSNASVSLNCLLLQNPLPLLAIAIHIV